MAITRIPRSIMPERYPRYEGLLDPDLTYRQYSQQPLSQVYPPRVPGQGGFQTDPLGSGFRAGLWGGVPSQDISYSPTSVDAAMNKYQFTEEDRQAIRETATRLGISPDAFTAVMAYESDKSMDPDKIGGAHNAYRGLIQFGKDERKEFGYRPGMTVAEQVQGPVYRYLVKRGLQPGMGIAHLYSIINAGSLTKKGEPRWNAPDQNGTVREHVQRITKEYFGKGKVSYAPDGQKLPPADIPNPPPTADQLIAGRGPPRAALGYADTGGPAVPGGPPTLRKGATDAGTGGAVTRLQRQLTDAGFNVGPRGVDGKYGKDTAAAVRAVEKQYRLDRDRGVAGPQVQAALAGNERLRIVADTRARFGDPLEPGGFVQPASPFNVGAGIMPGAGALPSGFAGDLPAPGTPERADLLTRPDRNRFDTEPMAGRGVPSAGPGLARFNVGAGAMPGAGAVPSGFVPAPRAKYVGYGDVSVPADTRARQEGDWTAPPAQDTLIADGSAEMRAGYPPVDVRLSAAIPGEPAAPVATPPVGRFGETDYFPENVASASYTTGVPGRTGDPPAPPIDLGNILAGPGSVADYIAHMFGGSLGGSAPVAAKPGGSIPPAVSAGVNPYDYAAPWQSEQPPRNPDYMQPQGADYLLDAALARQVTPKDPQADAAWLAVKNSPANRAAEQADLWRGILAFDRAVKVFRDSPAFRNHRLSTNIEDRREDPISAGPSWAESPARPWGSQAPVPGSVDYGQRPVSAAGRPFVSHTGGIPQGVDDMTRHQGALVDLPAEFGGLPNFRTVGVASADLSFAPSSPPLTFSGSGGDDYLRGAADALPGGGPPLVNPAGPIVRSGGVFPASDLSQFAPAGDQTIAPAGTVDPFSVGGIYGANADPNRLVPDATDPNDPFAVSDAAYLDTGRGQPAGVAARGAIGAVKYVKPQTMGQRLGGFALRIGANAVAPGLGSLLGMIYDSSMRNGGSFDTARQYTGGPVQYNAPGYGGVTTTPYGTRQYTTPGGSQSNSLFTPVGSGWNAPSFNQVSGGPLYAYNTETHTYIDSRGNEHPY